MITLNDGRAELWQWDTGRTLAVDADCSQVHFSNKVFGRSIDVDVVGGAAVIPDILLQTDKDLNVWAFVGTAENGYTKISKTLKVNRRNKPADYVFTQTDQMTLAELAERLDKIEESQDPDAIKNAVADYISKNPITVEETDPTVPAWAKQPEKPSYTAAEVGALPDTYTPPNQTAQQVGADPAGTASSAVSQHNVDTAAHNDLRLALQGLSDRINAALDSDDTTLDQMSEVVAYIKSNKSLIDAITTSKVSVADIVDNLTTNVANKPLSAAQGAALKVLIDAISIPDKLPNPNALTFTGAVTGTYDGSAPVSVAIPSGGGSGSAENWRLVNTVTTAEDVSDIRITQDSDGNPLSMKKVKIFVKLRGNSASLSTWCRITVNNLTNNFYSDIANTFAAKEGQDYYNYVRADYAIYAGRLMLEVFLRSLNNAASKNTLCYQKDSGCFENYPNVVDAITSIRMWSASAGIGAGTEIMVYGVDA